MVSLDLEDRKAVKDLSRLGAGREVSDHARGSGGQVLVHHMTANEVSLFMPQDKGRFVFLKVA